MKQNKPVPRRLVLAFGLAILVVLAGGVWFYNAQEQSLQRRVETQLQTVGQFKVDQITHWRVERLGDANVLMDNAFLVDAIARWMVAPQAEDAKLILSQFQSLQDHLHYADVELVDTSGQIRLSLVGESGSIHAEDMSTLAQVFRDRQPALTDLHFSPSDQAPHLDVMAPIFAQNGEASEPVGAVILEIAARQFLYPLLESWPTTSRTAETLLVRRDGDAALFLNDLRYQKGAALTRRIPLSRVDVPAVMVVLGQEGVVQGKDYRGVAVLAALKAVPDSPWFMVSKMDTDEAFADWRSQSIFILALILVFLTATVAGAGMVWQGNERAHYQSLAQTQASLRESEEKYRQLFENAQVGMYRSKIDGTAFLNVNNKLAEIIGFSREELLGASGRIRWAKQEDRDRMLKLLKEQGGFLVDYEAQVLAQNGAIKDVLASIKLLPDEGCLEGSMVDITERKRAEDALALNAVRLEALLELHKRMDAPQSQLLDFVLDASLKTAQSPLAFIGLLDEAEAVMTIHAFSKDALAQCALDEKPSRFPIAEAGIWGECVRRRTPFMLNQYDDPHPNKKGVPAGHVPIKRLLAIPIFDGEHIVAVAAVANKVEAYTESDSQALIVLLDRAWSIIRRKQVEEALRESEERFRRLFNSGNDAILVYGLDELGKPTTFSAVNDVACARLGYTRAELLNMLPPAINAPESAADFPAALKQLAENKSVIVTATHLAKDGRLIPVEISAQIFELGGKSLVLAIARDITERKQAEEEYRTIISTTMDGFWITDVQGRFLDVNDAYCHLIGYSREELLKTSIQDVEAAEKPEETARHIQKIIETGHDRFETRHRCKDGRIVDIEVSVNFQLGQGGRFYVFLRDITARKQAEESLRASEGRLHLATRVGNIGIWDWDVVKNELTWDDSMYSLYGIRKEDFGGAYETWSRTLHPDDRQFAEGEIQAALRGEREYAPEFRIVQPDGTIRIIKAASQTFRDRNGKALRMIGINIDITERKRAEADILKLNAELEQHAVQLEAARDEAERANRAKSEFLSRMSHELRTPLNSILGFAQLMEMDELNPKHAKGVGYILKAGRHLLDMINEVLDIARIESGRLALSLEPVQLRSLILETLDLVRPMADARRLTLELADSPTNDLFVRADRQRLKQVLLNLINNAIKYNREGGSMIVDCRPVLSEAEGLRIAETDSQSSFRNRQSAIRIRVSDTGPGIAPENLERLFSPFERISAEQTETEGTGLGLSVAQKLTKAMGGTIGVASVLSQGSTFWLELPQVENPHESAQRLSALEGIMADPTKTGTVLYVEDNLSNLQLVEQILTRRPAIELITAMQGRLAIDIALAHENQPDLILLDLDLPDMHGADVLRRLRAEPKTQAIPVVVLSADATLDQIERLKAAGVQDYLTKPLDVRQLLQVVDKIMGDR